jgi:glycerol dehydrogenase-like iron-containing ADH family enzyme
MNVSITDIKEIGIQNGIELSEEQIQNVLREYNTIVMDKAEGWDELIKHLIVKQTTIQILKENNK